METGRSDSNEKSEFTGKTILIVDDSPINRKIIVHVLKPKDFRILMAQNGQQALSVMHEQSPNLVLMDMQMPVMDGYEATRQAKQNPAIMSIPVIALTATDTDEERAHCMQAGCDGYIPKPVSQALLFETIDRFLSKDNKNQPAQSLSMDSSWIPEIAQALQGEYLPQLQTLLSEDNPAELRRFGHTMKGLGLQFQLESLAEWGDNFEQTAETLSSEALRQQAEQFENIAHAILTEAAAEIHES